MSGKRKVLGGFESVFDFKSRQGKSIRHVRKQRRLETAMSSRAAAFMARINAPYGRSMVVERHILCKVCHYPIEVILIKGTICDIFFQRWRIGSHIGKIRH